MFSGQLGLFYYLAVEMPRVDLRRERIQGILYDLSLFKNIRINLREILNYSACLKELSQNQQIMIYKTLLDEDVNEFDLQGYHITETLQFDLLNFILTSPKEFKYHLGIVSLYKNTFLNTIFMMKTTSFAPSIIDGTSAISKLANKLEAMLCADPYVVLSNPSTLKLIIDKNSYRNISRFRNLNAIVSVNWQITKQKIR